MAEVVLVERSGGGIRFLTMDEKDMEIFEDLPCPKPPRNANSLIYGPFNTWTHKCSMFYVYLRFLLGFCPGFKKNRE